MSRSLFAKLHRRYGARLSGSERVERAAQQLGALTKTYSLGTTPPRCGDKVSNGVAIVGAGFAGLAAAHILGEAGVTTTVFEAREMIGGRVQSDRTSIPGRVLELGAELIGMNHPLWISWAKRFGLGLSVITGEDQFAGAALEMPDNLGGAPVKDPETLYRQMAAVLRMISGDAKAVTDAYRPWTAKGAAALDALSVAKQLDTYVAKIPKRHPQLRLALEVFLGNDQAVPTKDQSYLGLLALVKGGQFGSSDVDLAGYWDVTEE